MNMIHIDLTYLTETWRFGTLHICVKLWKSQSNGPSVNLSRLLYSWSGFLVLHFTTFKHFYIFFSEQKLMSLWTYRREYRWRQSQLKQMKGHYQQEWPVSILYFIYCKFGNFREGFIFAKLRICEVSWK